MAKSVFEIMKVEERVFLWKNEEVKEVIFHKEHQEVEFSTIGVNSSQLHPYNVDAAPA